MGAGEEEKGYVYIAEPVEWHLGLGLRDVFGGGWRRDCE